MTGGAAPSRSGPAGRNCAPGDGILMIPVSGFDVVGIEDRHCFAARTPDGTKPGWRSEIFDDAPHDHAAALQAHHDPRISGQRFAP
jgi:hypothetical protein